MDGMRRDRERTDIDDLVRRLQTGGMAEDDFRILFQRYYRLVRYFFSERGCEPQECENLTQETFLAVYRGLAGFRHEASFDAWLLGIARNLHAQALRARQRIAVEIALAEVPEHLFRSDAPGAEAAFLRVQNHERRQAVRELMAGFPDQMRSCAELRFQQGLSYREIAESLDMSLDAVKVQLARARKRLQHQISDDALHPHP